MRGKGQKEWNLEGKKRECRWKSLQKTSQQGLGTLNDKWANGRHQYFHLSWCGMYDDIEKWGSNIEKGNDRFDIFMLNLN